MKYFDFVSQEDNERQYLREKFSNMEYSLVGICTKCTRPYNANEIKEVTKSVREFGPVLFTGCISCDGKVDDSFTIKKNQNR